MKKLFALLFLIGSGCSHAMLTRTGKSYKRTVAGTELVCSVVNEWDVSAFDPEKKKAGCWCMAPIMPTRFGAMILFQFAKDAYCKDGEPPTAAPVKKTDFESDIGL